MSDFDENNSGIYNEGEDAYEMDVDFENPDVDPEEEEDEFGSVPSSDEEDEEEQF